METETQNSNGNKIRNFAILELLEEPIIYYGCIILRYHNIETFQDVLPIFTYADIVKFNMCIWIMRYPIILISSQYRQYGPIIL